MNLSDHRLIFIRRDLDKHSQQPPPTHRHTHTQNENKINRQIHNIIKKYTKLCSTNRDYIFYYVILNIFKNIYTVFSKQCVIAQCVISLRTL